jgi:hypothetical protein
MQRFIPDIEIEDGAETPPPARSPLASYDEDHILVFDQTPRRSSIETVILSNVLATSYAATNLSRFLSYVLRQTDKDILNLLSKLAKNQIQFTFALGTAPITLEYFQAISAIATKKYNTLTVNELERSFGFEDELDAIFALGVNQATAFANDFVKLNKHAKALSEREINADVANLRLNIKNIAADIKSKVDKSFTARPAPQKATTFAAAAVPQTSDAFFQPASKPSVVASESVVLPQFTDSATAASSSTVDTLFQSAKTHPKVNNDAAKVPLLGHEQKSDNAEDLSSKCCCRIQ